MTASIAFFISSTGALQPTPHLTLLSKRADITPGSPLYNCHEACGEVILISQTTDYCSNSTFTTDLNSCLKCALTYNIWQYYGDDVKSAAKTCSDDATPSSSSATSNASSTAATVTTGSATGSTSSAIAETASATSTGSATGTTTSASASTGAASIIEQNAVLLVLVGALAWALSL
ncbi:hypothetical protein N7499_011492 [Penicillium canescens]|uniref:Uncharacterized protein n=1 Tax=Penicillium canescens TaxID=5083 RepID=A0AAD6NCZ9_PENCN|nr:uncharacterized protein N7446_006750 [Penicillium canescens]KAJ5990947.1 hypothetical protein N7522_011154 [Penicillium canescens]KAJ6049923.1 hypothetical protein N7444_006639 [Penicillium canescens]KAJ6052108.1 hypothetical protein N7460_002642 [Penicillium canescens]KAJ6062630.1 hypothetical protein N7446_006750 [Penicillium canescens]KAJ6069605.1 hypothetical protein N7499_011492 [Penicillium canescens]